MNSFDKYREADLIQCAIARHYEQEYGASVVSIGNAPKWDIQFSNGVTMEIKLDAMASRTFNAAIEFWDSRRKKPTGILETKAKLWLHCVPRGEGLKCYELETKRLLKLCIESGEVKIGGDNNASVMKIIPLQKIREISNQDFWLEISLDIMTKERRNHA